MAKDHVDDYERDDGTHVSGYDRDEDPTQIEPSEDEDSPTSRFGPDGELAGTNPVDDPEGWEAATSHLDPETLEELTKVRTRDYLLQKQKQTKASKVAKRHALAAERERRGLVYKPQVEPHSRRVLRVEAKLRAEPREPEEESYTRPKEVQKLEKYKAKLEAQRIDLIAERAKKRMQVSKLSESKSKPKEPRIHPSEVQGALFTDPEDTTESNRRFALRHNQLPAIPPSEDEGPSIEELKAGRVQRELSRIDAGIKNYEKQIKNYDKQIKYYTRTIRGEGRRVPGNLSEEAPRRHRTSSGGPIGDKLNERLGGTEAKPLGGREPLLDIPTPTKLKAEIKEHNKLQARHLKNIQLGGEGLQGAELNRYRYLDDKLHETYDLIQSPDEKGRLPEDIENDRIESSLPEVESYLRPEYKDGKRKGDEEDVAGEIERYGQENPHLGLIEGWKATTRFQKEQAARKIRALRVGEFSVGVNKGNFVAPESAPVTIGSNQDILVRTKDWSPAKKAEAETGRDSFTVKLTHKAQRKRDFDEEGNYYTEGQNISKTISDLDIPGLDYVPLGTGNDYKIFTHQGTHLNPDQIAALKEGLKIHHGLEDFSVDDVLTRNKDGSITKKPSTIGFIQKKKRVPIGYNKLPVDKNDVVSNSVRTLYSSRVGAKHGERDPYTRELLPEERDTLGLKVGRFAVQKHFREDTDAIGWGTSWRPGQKEITGAAMALPRAKRDRQLMEAYQASLDGNEEKMNAYIANQFPNAETQAEMDEQKSISKKQAAELLSAATAAGYYTAKKNAVPRAVNAGYAKVTRRFPGVSDLVRRHNLEQDQPQGGLMKDLSWAYRRPWSNRIQRAKFRLTNPLASGSTNPITGKIEPDPTVPGIMNEQRLNLPSWRYRKHFRISPGEYQGRKIEKNIYRLKGIVDTKEHVTGVIKGEIPANRLQRKAALWQAKTILHDPHRNSTLELEKQIKDIKATVYNHLPTKRLPDPEFTLHGRATSISKEPEYREYLDKAAKEIDSLLKRVGEGKGKASHEELDQLVRKYVAEHPSPIPKAIGRAGKAGLVGGTVVGGSLLAVDRYQTYKYNKGEQVNHPILNTLVPERIMIPKVRVQKTSEYAIPHNSVTDALDLQGEKIPLTGKVSIQMEQKAQLRNHRDISGQPYNSNLPILGGVHLSPPVKVEGSLKKSITQKAPTSGLGTAKNMYIAGKRVPVDISIGKKERWSDKDHKLAASNNRFKLDQDDREKLVLLANQTPRFNTPESEKATISGQEAQIRAFYANDSKLMEMLEDPKEVRRIQEKNRYWLMGNKSRTPNKISEIKGDPDEGMTAEEVTDMRKAQRKERKDFQQERKEQERLARNART